MSAQSAVWCCTSCGAVYHKDFPRCPNDGAEVQLAARDPLLDQSIGHYVIDRLIGEGGMGRVYAAHHATLPAKRYAIKVLLGDVAATSSMRRRFAKEAESASKLDHPNIVHVQDFGEMASGLPYIVMDYLDGVALTTLFDGCPMEPARVVHIARAVCEALAYAHDAGVVHRDLKPDNIIVVIASDGSEVPRIADFGLATTIDPSGASRITTTGMAMGTPAYAAPEQMAGKRVDRRADLYSLGMTLFEMLTGGKLPFEGHPLEMMTAKAHKEAPRLSEIAPNVILPPGLEDLIAQLIRRKYADRPTSAREVMAALDRIAGGTGKRVSVAGLARSSDDMGRAAQQVAITLGVRRKPRMWPWLMAGGLSLGGAFGWGYHRRDSVDAALQSVLQTVFHSGSGDSSPSEPAIAAAPVAPPVVAMRPDPAPANPSEAVDTAAIEIDPNSHTADTAPPEAVPETAAKVPAEDSREVATNAAPQPAKPHPRKDRRSGSATPRTDGPDPVHARRSDKPAGIADRSSPLLPSTTVQAAAEVGGAGSASAKSPTLVQPSNFSPRLIAAPAPAAPALAPPTPARASAPGPLVAEITHIDVTGALSQSSVRHAVERVMPAIHQCVSSVPRTIKSHFTIDESRRAQNVRGSSDCIVAALGGVRIETAPDVGDAEVEVQIRFAPKP